MLTDMLFDVCEITLQGEALKNKNVPITFTRIKLGDGVAIGDASILTDLVSPKVDVKPNDLKLDSLYGMVEVKGKFTTDAVKQGFFWKECGLYAMDPTVGEILYCYASSSQPDYIAPADSGMMEEILVSMVATVGSNTNVNITIDDSMVFATKKVVDKKPYYYACVADMKADTSLKAGDMAVTLGYYTAKDGGEGEYTIVSDQSIDNGGSVHTLTNGLKAKLVVRNNTINILQFGAKGGEGTNDTERIQNAINTRYNIVFNAVTYYINDTLVVHGNTSIRGFSRDKTSIVMDPAVDKAIIKGADNQNYRLMNFHLSDISLNGHLNMTENAVACLDLRNAAYSKISRVSVRCNGSNYTSHAGCDGINVTPTSSFCGYMQFDHCYVTGYKNGITANVNDLLLTGGMYNAHELFGVNIIGGAVVHITGIEASSNGRDTTTDLSGGISLKNVTGGNIGSNWHEYNARSETMYDYNDIMLDKTSKNITTSHSRYWTMNNNSYATDVENKLFKKIVDNEGYNEYSNISLVENGDFEYKNSNLIPCGWEGSNFSVSNALDIPELEQIDGYGRGIRISPRQGGTNSLGTTILKGDKLRTMLGKRVSIACLVRLHGVENRCDIVLKYGDLHSSSGLAQTIAYSRISKTNQVMKVYLTGVINQECVDAGVLNIGFFHGLGQPIDVWSVSCVEGADVPKATEKVVTSSGGCIWSQEFKIGGKRHGWGTEIPISGSWIKGDIIYNTSPGPGGFIGWVCITSGTPGMWKGFGLIEN